MTFPSGTLLAQSALSGVFIGSLYGLLGLGLGLSWGLLHIINLAHFGFAFLAAYLCYQLASVGGIDPLLTLALIVPLFFALGVAVQWLLSRFSVSPLNSLLATFGLTAIIEAGIQYFWTADFRKLESVYSGQKLRVGELFVPMPELLTLVLALLLGLGIWAAMRYTDLGRALRALAEDAPMAAAFGVNRRAHALLLSGVCGALAGIAGVCLALSLHADAVADLRVGRRRVRRRDAGRTGFAAGAARRRHRHRRQRGGDDGVHLAVVGADRVVLAADRAAAAAPGPHLKLDRTLVAIAAAGLLLAVVPFLHLPAFYESFLYLVFHWIVLATSWNILSRLLRLFLVRPRRVLRRRRLHDGGAGRQVRRAVPVDAARGRARRGAAGAGTRRGGLPRAPRARRVVRAADAGGHVRARDDRPQHADRRRPGRLPVRGAGAEARADAVGRVLPDGARARDRRPSRSRTRSRARDSGWDSSPSTTTRTRRR